MSRGAETQSCIDQETPMSAIPQAANDPDTLETQEWIEALETVLEREGAERAHFLLEALIDKARRKARTCRSRPTRPTSTRSRSTTRSTPRATWSSRSACAPTCAGTRWRWWCRPTGGDGDLGGHIASFASLATLFGVGFNHFWHAERGPRRRPALHPGPLFARHLCARLSGRPPQRGAARQLPPGGRRQGRRRRIRIRS